MSASFRVSPPLPDGMDGVSFRLIPTVDPLPPVTLLVIKEVVNFG